MEENPCMTRVKKSGEEYPSQESGLWAVFEWDGWPEFHLVKAPYQPGDMIYVRETWNRDPFRYNRFIYKADGYGPDKTWRPSIHMPRQAARIFLRVTNVRVERLQDIGDCTKEGIMPGKHETAHMNDYDERCDFKYLWNSTIKPAERALYGWDANPWVFVISFERISKDEALQ